MTTFPVSPIETKYGGYTFRSRTEARYAFVFDKLNMKYHYEMEPYGIEPRRGYLPDFWLPDSRCFLEVKGMTPTKEELAKAEALCIGLDKTVYVISGDPYTMTSVHRFGGLNWGYQYTPQNLAKGNIIAYHKYMNEENRRAEPVYLKESNVLHITEKRLYTYFGPEDDAFVGFTWGMLSSDALYPSRFGYTLDFCEKSDTTALKAALEARTYQFWNPQPLQRRMAS